MYVHAILVYNYVAVITVRCVFSAS